MLLLLFDKQNYSQCTVWATLHANMLISGYPIQFHLSTVLKSPPSSCAHNLPFYLQTELFSFALEKETQQKSRLIGARGGDSESANRK